MILKMKINVIPMKLGIRTSEKEIVGKILRVDWSFFPKINLNANKINLKKLPKAINTAINEKTKIGGVSVISKLKPKIRKPIIIITKK